MNNMDGPVDGTAMKWQNGDRKKLMDKKTNIEKEASKATPQETWDYSGGNAWWRRDPEREHLGRNNRGQVGAGWPTDAGLCPARHTKKTSSWAGIVWKYCIKRK
jgi:hypothetical protein